MILRENLEAKLIKSHLGILPMYMHLLTCRTKVCKAISKELNNIR